MQLQLRPSSTESNSLMYVDGAKKILTAKESQIVLFLLRCWSFQFKQTEQNRKPKYVLKLYRALYVWILLLHSRDW